MEISIYDRNKICQVLNNVVHRDKFISLSGLLENKI